MDYILIAIGLISIIGIRFTDKFWDDYISKKSTSAINGVFVLFVFLRHFNQYFDITEYDKVYTWIDGYVGQLIVVTFLFFSGYGIMSSITESGDSYVRTLVQKRILPLWLNYIIIVLIYTVINYCFGTGVSLIKVFKTFFAWDSVGNSNWYIFAILVMYVFVYISFSVFKASVRGCLSFMFALCILYCVLMSFFKEPHWYNTILVYPLGMLYRYKEKTIIKIFRNHWVMCLLLLATLFCCLEIAYIFTHSVLLYEGISICFVLGIVCVSTRIKVRNALLDFLGNYVFEIYMLQRIPMIILCSKSIDKYLVFVISFVFTVIVSVMYKLFISNNIPKLLSKISLLRTAHH